MSFAPFPPEIIHIPLGIGFNETLRGISVTNTGERRSAKLRPDLTTLIPGFYADAQGRLHLNMREFLVAHGMPDVPEMRAVAWEEIKEIFAGIKIIEIAD